MSEEKQDAVLILLGELKGQMNSFMIAHGNLENRVNELAKGLSEIQNSKAWLLGATAAISVVVGILIRSMH